MACRDGLLEPGGFDVVVGRQPIFDRDRLVVGYELLFRAVSGTPGQASARVGELMTAEVLFSSVSIGVDRLVGDKLAFVNAERGILTGEAPLVLPPGRVVVEVLETVVLDEEAIAGCRRLVGQGYRLALDDVASFAELEPLLGLVSLAKIDLPRVPGDELAGLVERCRDAGVEVLAEKVETGDQMRICMDLGFHYFQGYLLSRPEVVSGRSIEPETAARLELVQTLVGDECDIREIERIVQSAPGLAYQLLELAGIGASRGTRRVVRSIREALVLVGWQQMQSWAALLLMVGRGNAPGEPSMTALVRARMCELLMATEQPSGAGLAFTAGMVSAFDVLLGVAIEEILEALVLGEELRNAVLRDDTLAGRIVADVVDYQLGQPDRSWRAGFGEGALCSAWAKATSWALEVARSVA
ncbi:MAG: EAL and HDOD domain-containing protein [Acidimicrobiales bacterium]